MQTAGPGLRVMTTRTVLLALSLGLGLVGFALFMRYGAADGLDPMDWVRS
jgi:hypothetical protein